MKRTIGLLVACGLAGGLGGWLGQGMPLAGAAGTATTVGFTPLEPTRIHDSRGPAGDPTTPILPAGTVITVDADVPDGATAVAVNIAMTQTAGAGYLTAWSGDGSRPFTASINATTAGENVSNYAVVPLATDGTFRVYTHAGTHIVIDRVGYFAGDDTQPGPKFVATISGYREIYSGASTTRVDGEVANLGVKRGSVRIEVTCPDGTVNAAFAYGIDPGEAAPWTAFCTPVITEGATAEVFSI